jgi:hypothetical protein
MSEFDSLRTLLKRAYDAGTHLAAPDFDTWLAGVAGGDLASALADMISTERVLPNLQPGVQIATQQGDYVIRSLNRVAGSTLVEMQDFVSYEREHMIQAVPSHQDTLLEATPRRFQCPATSCTLEVGHTGDHRGQFFHPNAGKMPCYCDGANAHVYSTKWCPESGAVNF